MLLIHTMGHETKQWSGFVKTELIVRFIMSKNDFRSEFVEISKAIHFWKAYNVRSQKNNVYICAAPS